MSVLEGFDGKYFPKILCIVYSLEKRLHNTKIYCCRNWSEQIQETHTAYSTDTQHAQQGLNDIQQAWVHRKTKPLFFFLYLLAPIAGATNPII